MWPDMSFPETNCSINWNCNAAFDTALTLLHSWIARSLMVSLANANEAGTYAILASTQHLLLTLHYAQTKQNKEQYWGIFFVEKL